MQAQMFSADTLTAAYLAVSRQARAACFFHTYHIYSRSVEREAFWARYEALTDCAEALFSAMSECELS